MSTAGFEPDVYKRQVHIYDAVSCTASSKTFAVTLPGSASQLPASYVGAYGVISGCGALQAQQSISGGIGVPIVSGHAGTGYTQGDVCPVTGGTLAGGGAATTIILTYVIGGVVQAAAVETPGGYSTAPSGNITVGTPCSLSSGAGAGLEVTATYVGGTVQGTITGVSGGTVVLSTAATITASLSNNEMWFGHNDYTAEVGAIAKGAHNLYYPSLAAAPWDSAIQLEYGQCGEVVTPTDHVIHIDFRGQTINALCPSDAFFQASYPASGLPSNWLAGSTIANGKLDGAGLVQRGIDVQGAYWQFNSVIVWNTLQDGFTVQGTVPSSHNASDNYFFGDQAHVSDTVVPAGMSRSLYYTANGSTDNALSLIHIWQAVQESIGRRHRLHDFLDEGPGRLA